MAKPTKQTDDAEFARQVIAAMPAYLRTVHALKEERAVWVNALFITLYAIGKARKESAASVRRTSPA